VTVIRVAEPRDVAAVEDIENSANGALVDYLEAADWNPAPSGEGRAARVQNMQMPPEAFERVDWSSEPPVLHPGETGVATWKTRNLGDIRIRLVEYGPGYLADHWCTKGHVLFCISGSMSTELGDGRVIELRPGQSYHVGDGSEPHRSSTTPGAKLLIVD